MKKNKAYASNRKHHGILAVEKRNIKKRNGRKKNKITKLCQDMSLKASS